MTTNPAYENARAKGFHAHGDELRARLIAADKQLAFSVESDATRGEIRAAMKDVAFYTRCLEEHDGNRLMLIVSEAVEAHEQRRIGRQMDEQYTLREKPDKPEGVPSELADIVIRTYDLAGENGIDLDAVIALKHAYNTTRPALHGKRF